MTDVSVLSQLGKGLIGGVILGASTSAFLGFGGQLTGISGFVHAGIWKEGVTAQPLTWRSLYLLALLSSGAAITALGYGSTAFGQTHTKPWALALAGALVGFGTRMGNGCTSGHGLCGLPRLSPRSFMAVGSFMATGFATAMLVRSPALFSLFHQPAALALRDVAPLASVARALTGSGSEASVRTVAAVAVGAAALALPAIRLVRWLLRSSTEAAAAKAPASAAAAGASVAPSLSASVITLACAGAFGAGLALSGMTRPETVQAFLDPLGGGGKASGSSTGGGAWDLTLAGVMGGGVLVNALSFWWASRQSHPPPFPVETPAAAPQAAASCVGPSAAAASPLCKTVQIGRVAANSRIDTPLLLGSALFGIGWGLAGICPGPGVVAVGGLQPGALIMLPFMVLGMGAYSFADNAGLLAFASSSSGASYSSSSATGDADSAACEPGVRVEPSSQLGVGSPLPSPDASIQAEADSSSAGLRERRASPSAVRGSTHA